MKWFYCVISITFLILSSFNGLLSAQVEITQIEPSCENDPDIILVSTHDPYYSIISTPIACSYNQTGQCLRPYLLVDKSILTNKQKEFIFSLSKNDKIISVGINPTNIQTLSYEGSAVYLSYQIAKSYFSNSSQALVLPYNLSLDIYTKNMLLTPLASYLTMPILLYDINQGDYNDLEETLNQLGVNKIYITPEFDTNNLNKLFEIILLENNTQIQQLLLQTIQEKFQNLNYITITNPSDIQPLQTIKIENNSANYSIGHNILFLFGKKIVISGTDTISKQISIPEGMHSLSIEVSMKNITSIFPSNDIPLYLSATLTDQYGRTVAYANSPGYQNNATYLETLICNQSGSYNLTITVFYGYRGGYFSLRGMSNVNAIIKIEEELCTLSTPHYPLVPLLSLNAAYLTSAHGGIIIVDEEFQLTDKIYENIADHHGTGPWYDETLHQYNNEKVQMILDRIQENLSFAKRERLYENYTNGSGWLALLGDTNMIPMYYYPSNTTHLAERGLPSDNPYSMNHQLSVGRILSYSTMDASLLIARTLFYNDLCGIPTEEDTWHRSFHFVFGEGFGETGGIFHQIPYANAIESYGFDTTVYGDFRNSRQAAERLDIYTDTNYVEYLGHGDWFWFTPSIYGFNSVGQSIGSIHAREWEIKRPNVFLTSACLMGRVDGVPPMMSIALSFLYAGSNAFVGATRETGQEAGLTVLEDHLILDDYSMGEALRGEKRVDKENPTYYVRCLFGDPAFNPYDPLHGFSDQGNPLS